MQREVGKSLGCSDTVAVQKMATSDQAVSEPVKKLCGYFELEDRDGQASLDVLEPFFTGSNTLPVSHAKDLDITGQPCIKDVHKLNNSRSTYTVEAH